MVLVDTSVWIRSLANRPPYVTELDRLLSLDEVTGHELVYGELLIGDRAHAPHLRHPRDAAGTAAGEVPRDVRAGVAARAVPPAGG